MNRKAPWDWVMEEVAAHKSEIACALLCVFASAGFYLLMTWWAATLVQSVFPSRSITLLSRHLLLGLAIFLIASLFTFGRAYLMARLTHHIATRTRARLFAHVLEVSPRLLHGIGGGNLMSGFSNDLGLFQGAVTGIVANLVPSAILAVCFGAAMVWNSWLLFCACVILLSPVVWLTSMFGRKLYVAVHKSQEGLARLFHRFDELIWGLKDIKSFGREKMVYDRFAAVNAETLAYHLRRERLDVLHPILVSLCAAFAVGAVILLSAVAIQEKLLTLETLTAFLVAGVLAYPQVQQTSHATGKLMEIRAVIERIDRILSVPVESDGTVALPKARLRGVITFENVSFAYGEHGFRLDGLNLQIEAGQMVALVGASGAGKSTILDFIPRFLSPQGGRVLIDGHDVSALRLSDLRRAIGTVPQEPVIFEATLEENLRFGAPDASQEDMLAAACEAHVDEFAQLMPGVYRARIEAHGSNLSVGQRQRIAIARAFLKNPKILLLDEPTSALDANSERLVRDAFKRASAGRTTLVVAHRMSTVRYADRILVIEHGRIVEDGPHKDLIDLHGSYYSLYAAQFGGGKESWNSLPV